MFSDLENMDVMLGSPHLDEIDTENISGNDNSEIRERSSNENEIRAYDRATGRENPIRLEILEKKLEILPTEMNTRNSNELEELLFSVKTQVQRVTYSAITSPILPQNSVIT